MKQKRYLIQLKIILAAKKQHLFLAKAKKIV